MGLVIVACVALLVHCEGTVLGPPTIPICFLISPHENGDTTLKHEDVTTKDVELAAMVKQIGIYMREN